MITKVQGKTVSGELSVKACPRLNPLEKGMLRWAVVDPEDRVLDACVGRGLMAEYLRRNMQARCAAYLPIWRRCAPHVRGCKAAISSMRRWGTSLAGRRF